MPKMFYMLHKNVVQFTFSLVCCHIVNSMYITHVKEIKFAIWMHAAVSALMIHF